MSGEAKRQSFWVNFAWIVGLIAVSDFTVKPLYRAMSPNMKYGVAVVLTMAVTIAFVWLLRATLRD